jgi:hypothetical protein
LFFEFQAEARDIVESLPGDIRVMAEAMGIDIEIDEYR